MIAKWKMEMLTFLTSLTLVSVGFSSWQVSSPPVPDLSATVGVDSVVQTDSFVSLADPTLFEYILGDSNEDSHFVIYENGAPVDKKNVANFSLEYTLYPEACASEISPFVETYYVEDDGSLDKIYYQYALITCQISTTATKEGVTDFFENVSSIALTNVALNTTNGTTNITNACSLSTDGTLVLKFETNRFINEENPITEPITITCDFSFTVKSDSMKSVCAGLANSKFNFHTQLSGTYQ